MKFRRNRQRENVDINLASLIDVVFVLLLFFVVTTTFTRETQLRVELPEAASAEQPPADQGKLVEVTISADGVYSVNNHLLPKSDLATLTEAIERESGVTTSCRWPSAPMARPRTRPWSPQWMPPASSVSATCA